ncbi:SDR family NAD(P)-dependent oxidoreductase [Streptomyces muensis]|uniref:SDR family oxidoreductase n=1 Tax=Streptomyces muensis TaxID=1077944 RepID=A0A9X1PWF6_STRM4|nr:SDR family oxidoreductase [Streptomyces muensis]MCF1592581.1 SDR family oxidoreductase [Streptomyces muensis]
MNKLDLTGRIALVTGGSRGIGRAVVRGLAAAGADVALSYRREKDQAEILRGDLLAAGRRAAICQADLAEPGAAARLYRDCVEEFGVPTLLVCNAGNASRGNSVIETPEEEFDLLWRVHVLSTLELLRAAVPAMRATGGGSVVLVSSTYAASRPAGTAPYVAAKSALEGVATVVAKEERPYGIRVNVVAPGLVATDMGDRLVRSGGVHHKASDLDTDAPFGRVCRPEDVADVVLTALAPLSSYVTGHRYVVDGGDSL